MQINSDANSAALHLHRLFAALGDFQISASMGWESRTFYWIKSD